MKIRNQLSLTVLALASTLLVSCIPGSRLRDCNTSLGKCHEEQKTAVAEIERLDGQLKQCEEQLQSKNRESENLKKDTSRMQLRLEDEIRKNEQLSQTNELLIKKNNEFLAENRLQTEKISTELSATQEALIRKEDALKKMEADLLTLKQELSATDEKLKQKEATLNTLEAQYLVSKEELDRSVAELSASQHDLASKQQKLLELQRALVQKDSMVNLLKKTVTDALMGFTDKGLKVEERNGKVYVSMENKLLFASASTVVGADGQKALVEIARVLQENPDINVLVEGHTDDNPLKGSGQMKDNWDLSVLRATEIVRILLASGKIDPARLTAAGRSQYLPVDPAATPEARTKNRRTEIILTPKLDELFRVIESN